MDTNPAPAMDIDHPATTALEAMRNARRCKAHSKRSGLPCKSPAVKGYNVCRMHGARGGAPKNWLNGRYSHGQRTDKHRAMMALIKICGKAAKAC